MLWADKHTIGIPPALSFLALRLFFHRELAEAWNCHPRQTGVEDSCEFLLVAASGRACTGARTGTRKCKAKGRACRATGPRSPRPAPRKRRGGLDTLCLTFFPTWVCLCAKPMCRLLSKHQRPAWPLASPRKQRQRRPRKAFQVPLKSLGGLVCKRCVACRLRASQKPLELDQNRENHEKSG